jgi:hypothetical protein
MKSAKRFAQMLFVSFWIWVAATSVFLVGCKDDSTPPDDTRPWCPGNIILQMDTDTLAYLPGDTVTAQGFVIVTNQQGLVVPNIKVALSKSEQFGAIIFEDSVRRDTTNSVGRVQFFFQAFASNPGPGHNTITATVGACSTQWVLAVVPETDILSRYRYHISVNPNRLHLAPPYYADSTLVTLTFTDSRGNPTQDWTPNELVRLSSCAGGWNAFPDFDSTGTTSTWWYLEQNPGTCCVYVGHDSACVVVDTLR